MVDIQILANLNLRSSEAIRRQTDYEGGNSGHLDQAAGYHGVLPASLILSNLFFLKFIFNKTS